MGNDQLILMGDEKSGHILAPEGTLWFCAHCKLWLLEAPKDKLGAGNGTCTRGVLHSDVRRSCGFRKHQSNPKHAMLTLRKLQGDAAPSAPPPTIRFQGAEFFQLQHLKNVYHTVFHKDSLASVEQKRR